MEFACVTSCKEIKKDCDKKDCDKEDCNKEDCDNWKRLWWLKRIVIKENYACNKINSVEVV